MKPPISRYAIALCFVSGILFDLVAFADTDVLRSGGDSTQGSKLVLSTDKTLASDDVAPSPAPSQKITLKFVPKNPPAAPVKTAVLEKPASIPYSPTNNLRKTNPHAIKPKTVSPFVKQTSSDVPVRYSRRAARVFNPGAATGAAAGTVTEIELKQNK